MMSSNAMSGLASTLESRVTLTVQGSTWIATHILPYVRVSPYTGVTLTVPGPSMDSHCYTPPPPPPPYVRVSPYTGVTLTVPGPSMDSHCYTPPLYQSIPVHRSYSDSPRTVRGLLLSMDIHCYTPPPPPPPYVRVSLYTGVTLTDPGPSMDSHCYTPPMSEYPCTPELL